MYYVEVDMISKWLLLVIFLLAPVTLMAQNTLGPVSPDRVSIKGARGLIRTFQIVKLDNSEILRVASLDGIGSCEVFGSYICESMRVLWEAEIAHKQVIVDKDLFSQKKVFIKQTDYLVSNQEVPFDFEGAGNRVQIYEDYDYYLFKDHSKITVFVDGAPKYIGVFTYPNLDFGQKIIRELAQLRADNKNIKLRFSGLDLASLYAIVESAPN
jgi:hypothetical protein